MGTAERGYLLDTGSPLTIAYLQELQRLFGCPGAVVTGLPYFSCGIMK
jgi:hypothetical protein